MNQQTRDAIRYRLAELVEAAGPDGIGFRTLYAQITREFTASRRNVQDQLFKLDAEGVIVAGGLTKENVCVYRHSAYKRDMTDEQRRKAAIYAFRPLKTFFAGIKPARFDHRGPQ